MKKDIFALKREKIIEKPGYLAAKIIYNLMFDNNFDLCFIGNTMGNTLYTVQLNNSQTAIVCFTSDSLLESYVNRKVVKKTISSRFGNEIVSVTMNICTLDAILSGYESPNDETVETIIVNPNTKDYFLPLNIKLFSSMIIKSGYINEEDIDIMVNNDNIKKMEYDTEENKFFFSGEIN